MKLETAETFRIRPESRNIEEVLIKAYRDGEVIKMGGSSFVVVGHDCVTFVLQAVTYSEPTPWTGEGLPPVGTVCEVKGAMSHYLQWNKVTVFAVRGKTVFFDTEDGRWGNTASHEFRPLRTPDQIAAEEKGKTVTEMMAGLEPFEQMAPLAVAEYLYDAGYRKQARP